MLAHLLNTTKAYILTLRLLNLTPVIFNCRLTITINLLVLILLYI